jgi:HK97 family phage major capsid protein
MDLRKQHTNFVQKAENIVSVAERENKRVLTETEKAATDSFLAQAKALVPEIKHLESRNTLASQVNEDGIPLAFLSGGKHKSQATENMFPQTSKFILRGELPEMEAYTGEDGGGGSVSYVIPAYEIERFILAYPNFDSFASAGASLYPFSDFPVVDRKIPILSAGSAATTYAAGTGPNTSQDASFIPLTISHSKYALLTKFSEEFSEDAPSAIQAAIAESLARVTMSQSNAFTTAMLASLASAGAEIATGEDYLQLLLDLEAAVPSVFANQGNAFMVSRLSLAAVRNLRDAQDRPIFDPQNRTLLGHPTILNDALGGRVVFGNFGTGAHISRGPFQLLRLTEAYREQGQVGIRYWQRSGAKFYSDAVTSGSNQPLWMSESTDIGS